MAETLLRPAVLGPVVVVVSYVLYQILRASRTKLPDLPIVGAKPGEWFPLQRARWRNVTNMRESVFEAYRLYKNRACIFPVAGGYDFVLLPRKEQQWLLDQPDSRVSIHDLNLDILQTQYTLPDPKLATHPVHHDLVKGVLTRETGNLVPALYDEVQYSVDALYGSEPGVTKEVPVYSAVQDIICQVTNRVFVGLPFCRNPDLLKNGVAFAMDIPLAANLLKFVWEPLRPLVALVFMVPSRLHTNRFVKILRPEVERRIADYDARQADPETKAADGGVPNDFLQWSLQQAKALGDPYMYSTYTLASRVLLLNFASIHTSSFAMANAVFDIAASASPAQIDELRAEIKSVLAEHGGVWNKRAIQQMHKLDSTMRESQRMNSVVVMGTGRRVVDPRGLTTPEGCTCRPGPSWPGTPFRFAEMRQQQQQDDAGDKKEGGGGSASYVQRARQAWATTSPEFVAFGHGRHACPGRFFASTELKLLLAYTVLHYDFEHLEKRPSNSFFAASLVPPMKETVKMTRRAHT
ncbi:hypothetical protein PG995_005068 [Apiospora arundinis]